MVEATKRAPKTSQINRTKRSVLDATIELLASEGYSVITIERIAASSGVARSTIYRHWDSLTEIVLDAVQQQLGEFQPPADSGNVRSDLLRLYERFVRALQRGELGQIIHGVVEAAMADEVFAEVLRRAIELRRSEGRAVIEMAIERGDLSADTPVAWTLDAISGPIYYRLLMSGDPIDEPGFIEHLIDAALSQA